MNQACLSIESSDSLLRLLFASRQRLFGNALASLITEHSPSSRVVIESNSPAVIAAIGDLDHWNIILLDELFIRSTVSLLNEVERIKNRVPVAILADPELTSQVDIYLNFGIVGVLNKQDDIETFFCGCRAISAGETWVARPWQQVRRQQILPLTPRQQQVLTLLKKGLSNKQIAARLNCKENTIKVHLRTIFRILGVRTRIACLRAAEAEGWLMSIE
ncbi:response regulator transcription factor [Microbulbifer sp. A4B17]|uniref:response regulator transcription factor n=1 Tax=Microbulbifer sp. A4B17 TaxID=359370 RepID=UPI0013004006|nr:response regulator transcription factor [Microbulbifer sp. A4B17]